MHDGIGNYIPLPISSPLSLVDNEGEYDDDTYTSGALAELVYIPLPHVPMSSKLYIYIYIIYEHVGTNVTRLRLIFTV